MVKITILLCLLIVSAVSMTAGVTGEADGPAKGVQAGGGSAAALKPHAAQEDEPKTINRTQGFRIVSLARAERDYVLSLKNTYTKAINGYSVGVGAKSKITTDLTIGDNVIAPGETTQLTIPSSNLQSGAAGTNRPVIVLGVVFEDGTSDGDTQAIAEITQRRLGVKTQFKRIVPLLQAALASKDGDKAAALEQLKAQVSSLPETPDAGHSAFMAGGLRSAKQDVILMLDEVGPNAADFREKLSHIKAHAEKRIARAESP